jgi:hypothetical protein
LEHTAATLEVQAAEETLHSESKTKEYLLVHMGNPLWLIKAYEPVV